MDNDKIWPSKYKAATVISINLDAEFRWFGQYPDLKQSSLTALTVMAKNGTNHGLPRMLDLLNKYNVRATFFVAGAFAERYPEIVKNIDTQGHEIASLGYESENMAMCTPTEQEEIIKKSKTLLEETVGHPVLGFRAPDGELSNETLQLALKNEFKYSSNLFSDFEPFLYQVSETQAIPELPLSWALVDLPYFIASFGPVQPAGQNRISNYHDVLDNWKWEIQGYQQLGGCAVMQFNPQVIGNLGRLKIFELFLDYITGDDEMWIAPANEIMAQFMGVAND